MDGNSSLPLMMGMALILGIRHGFDLDHLATIDAITRCVRDWPILSKIVGLLFSVGHGIVVTAISLLIGSGIMNSHVPEWLDGFGSWISILFLLLFGILNLWTIFRTDSDHAHAHHSALAKFLRKAEYNPALILLIGALFAFSFDTFTQIALFSISGSLMSGWLFSGILGVSFTLGMICSDGLNGYLVSKLVRRADKDSPLLSRSLGLVISLFSLITGIVGLAEMM